MQLIWSPDWTILVQICAFFNLFRPKKSYLDFWTYLIESLGVLKVY